MVKTIKYHPIDPDYSPMVQSFIGVDAESIDNQIYEFEQWHGRDHPCGIKLIYRAETIWDDTVNLH